MIVINHQSWLSQLIGRNSSSLRPLSLSARCTRVFAYLTGDTLQRESGCFSKGASPSTVDNQFPLHTRARTTPISQGSSPSLLKAESWNQASDHPCLVAFHRTRARARTHEIFPSVWQFSRAGRTWQPPRRTALLPKKNQSVRWTTVGKVWGFVMGSGSVGGCSVEKIYRAGRGGRPIYSQRVRSSLWKIDGEREEKGRRLKGAVKRM